MPQPSQHIAVSSTIVTPFAINITETADDGICKDIQQEMLC